MHMKITGDNSSEVRKSLAAVDAAVRALVAEGKFAEAHNRLYESERIAYDAGLYAEASQYRKTQNALRNGHVPSAV